MGFAETQIDGALLLQRSEAFLSSCIESIAIDHSISPAHMLVLRSRLTDLVDIARRYGRLESIHEILLKDDKRNTEKED